MSKNLLNSDLPPDSELFFAVGSSCDLIGEIAHWGFDYRIDEFELDVDAHSGLRLITPSCVDPGDTIRVSMPEGATVGDLIAALYVCPLPALVLHILRASPGGALTRSEWNEIFESWFSMFSVVLKNFDGREVQSWFEGALAEAMGKPSIDSPRNPIDGKGRE